MQPMLPAGDQLGTGAEQVGGLARAELGGDLGLFEVVGACRAAAELPLRGRDELEPSIVASSARGAARTLWAWARWQASW